MNDEVFWRRVEIFVKVGYAGFAGWMIYGLYAAAIQINWVDATSIKISVYMFTFIFVGCTLALFGWIIYWPMKRRDR